METTTAVFSTQAARRGGWAADLLHLLPMWLILLAISAEGFPPPPIPGVLAIPMMLAALALSVALLSTRRMPFELFLYSLIPIGYGLPLDEITNKYKFFFILTLGAAMTLGALIALRLPRRSWRALGLLASAIVCILLAGNASASFWRLQHFYNVGMCFFDYVGGCPPLPADAPPWWQVFLGIW